MDIFVPLDAVPQLVGVELAHNSVALDVKLSMVRRAVRKGKTAGSSLNVYFL